MPSSNDKNDDGSNGKSSSSSSAGRRTDTASQEGGQSNYRMVKDGWGDRVNFQASMGLGMTPEDIDEGNQILDAFRDADAEQASQRK
ncbi:hypothetical protein VPNG_09695 [Cytospora leucostoma]|uniref:Uncharacterized protein n=1 Tax=Cytospora leucostoma TaxID=1230097 RepID=A0A423VJP7_9PEZI|nr:hypothetical protein VPNG_09695 [Cytospora leucostoma]